MWWNNPICFWGIAVAGLFKHHNSCFLIINFRWRCSNSVCSASDCWLKHFSHLLLFEGSPEVREWKKKRKKKRPPASTQPLITISGTRKPHFERIRCKTLVLPQEKNWNQTFKLSNLRKYFPPYFDFSLNFPVWTNTVVCFVLIIYSCKCILYH